MSGPLPVAVVTGAGRGIGRAIALRLAATHTVVAMGRDAQRLESLADECGALPVVVDVADPGSVGDAWTVVTERVGDPDLLVNNAGVSEPAGPVWEQDVAQWWRVFEVNVRGTFLTCRATLPAMVARGNGRIVNVSSNAAFFPASRDLGLFDVPAYMSSKAAVVRLTEVMAGETAGTGVSVFAISPGTVKTDMTASIPAFHEDWDSDDLWSPPELAAELVEHIASGERDALSGRYLHAATTDWRTLGARAQHVLEHDGLAVRLRPEGPEPTDSGDR